MSNNMVKMRITKAQERKLLKVCPPGSEYDYKDKVLFVPTPDGGALIQVIIIGGDNV